MTPEAKQRIQLALVLALSVAALRAGYILYERHQDNLAAQQAEQKKNAGYSNPDYYVNPKKLYPQDLKSARALTQQPVWVKEGYRYTYYPYEANRVNFDKEAGLLLPIEKLQIKDVTTASASGKKQVVAIFEKEGKSYAVPIGYENDGQFKIYSDEMFYIEDPRELYKHWSADVWQSVDKHEVKPGMNELQAVFAIGMGVPDSGSELEKTVRYPNGGKPMVVTYRSGKAVTVQPGTPAT